jgi:thiol-disulfide isomerase/thioredoxin
MIRTTAIAVALAALLIPIGSAHGAKLGDPAPPLNIGTWVKGNPVAIEKGNIYVVEFWATHCPPCIVSIPRLTELQKKYAGKGVEFVSISNEAAATVEPFVEDQGERMEYTVALDNGYNTAEGYMRAYNQSYIPTAFIVDREGRVVWFGSPLRDLEDILEGVVNGTYNYRGRVLMDEYAALLFQGGTPSDIDAKGEEFYKEAKQDVDALNMVAYAIYMNPRISHRNKPFARQLIDTAMEVSKGEDPYVLTTLAGALHDEGKPTEALETAEKALAQTPEKEENLARHLNDKIAEYKSAVTAKPEAP